MRRRAYGAARVNDVDVAKVVHGPDGLAVVVGVDVGKYKLLAVCRWADGRFERPWRIDNPGEIVELVALLKRLGAGRKLLVAMESSGTYGDAVRQALQDADIEVHRVSTKASHDYAEVFDGVPSQHDGKDAAVVAELAALGKSTWPEATRVLKLSSVTLLRVLWHYGSPQAVAADRAAAAQLARWGGRFLDTEKIKQLLAEARVSRGVRPGEWETRRIQDFAQQALQARAQGQRGQRRLRVLARGHTVLEAQGKVVGVPTACVLWVNTGDPRKFYAAAAYRKAIGLNLVERSSGTYQGQLHISKRGSARSRQWLYFAVLRLVQRAGVRSWYQAKKARDPDAAKSVLVAVMRKLALALYHVAVHDKEFDPRRLFARIMGSHTKTAPAFSPEKRVSVEG